MRELNPRAWIPSLNRYATGYDAIYYHRQMNNEEGEWWCYPAGEIIQLDVEIELPTGLKDKNGKEIHEGDIVRYAFEYPEGEWVEEVSFGKISDGEGYYHDYFLAWRTTDKDGDGHQSLLDLEGYCEVIGNIHENPELLEGEK